MSGNNIVGFIKSNKLRSFITILIIATGITSLTGVLTATDALKREVMSNFQKMGTGSFSIVQEKNFPIITYHQALAFKQQFANEQAVSIFTPLGNMPIKYGNITPNNPMTTVIAADESYLNYRNIAVKDGRMLSSTDITSARAVCLLGQNIAQSLFKDASPTGKQISIAGIRYEVVGTFTMGGTSSDGSSSGGSSSDGSSSGGSFGGGPDSEIIIPVTNARLHFVSETTTFCIGVCSGEEVYDMAEALFRAIRRLSPADVTDFRINRSDAMLVKLSHITGIITTVAAVTGLITLLGAAIGLMNIMLVSVKERTKEIGIRKAVGASAANIRREFLLESIIISQIGCAAGTATGILAGNAVAILLGASFIIPWMWILFAVIMCLVVGIASGYLPAAKAAALDPVEALRCE